MKMQLFMRFRHLFVVVMLLVSFVPFDSQQSYGAGLVEESLVQLDVDALLDSNDSVYQSCTSLPNDCSLRGAISMANKDLDQTYQIMLPAGTYELSIPGGEEYANATGDLDFQANITLIGAGVGFTVINAKGIDRVLQIHIGATATIQDVTLSGGRTADGAAGIDDGDGGDSGDGGGIFNAGTLILLDSELIANQTGVGGIGGSGDPSGNGGKSGNGGGIFNTGWLSIENTNVISNSTGTGGAGGSPLEGSLNCGEGNSSGNGGGIYNTGSLWMNNSQLSANKTSSGGEGGVFELNYDHYKCRGGYGGAGGGVYNTGSMQINASEITLNTAGRGAISQGNGGEGGGIYNSGSLTINDSQVYGNSTGDGADGVIKEGGWGGSGGGIYNRGQLFITDSPVEGNQTGSGGRGGIQKYGGARAGGNGGCGGGIFNQSNGILVLNITPIRDNITGPGGPSSSSGGFEDPGWGTSSEGGKGGGLYNEGEANVISSQVTGNVTGNGGADNNLATGGFGGSGGGIYNSGSLSLSNSLVLSNTAGQGGIREFEAGKKGGDGGGLYDKGTAVINGSKIVGNNAGRGGLGGDGFPDGPGGDGGGLYTFSGQLMLVNAIIAENTIQPGGSGSGMYLNSSADLFHVTLARNTGGDGSGVFVTYPMVYLTNTIVVSHTVGISVSVYGKVYLEDTLWGSEAWANGVDWSGNGTIITGTRNIWADPLFVNPDGMDYHLSASSPAIDQGIPTSINIDIDNQQRPNPGTNLADLGADEYWYFRWMQFLPMLYNRRD